MMIALGGRKFILTLIAMAVGAAIEIKGPHGLSANFAGLLAVLVGAFSVANVTATGIYEKSKNQGSPSDLDASISELTNRVAQVQNSTANIGEILIKASQGLSNVPIKK